MLQITIQGLGFGRSIDIDMLKTFGVTLEFIEVRELINNALSFTVDEANACFFVL